MCVCVCVCVCFPFDLILARRMTIVMFVSVVELPLSVLWSPCCGLKTMRLIFLLESLSAVK